MKAKREPVTPVFAPIQLTLETSTEALVLKYVAHYLVADAGNLNKLPAPKHFSREMVSDVMNRLWNALGSLGVDYTDGKA